MAYIAHIVLLCTVYYYNSYWWRAINDMKLHESASFLSSWHANLVAFPSFSLCSFALAHAHAPPHFPCNEDRLMVHRERYLTNPKPPDSSGNFTQNLSFFPLDRESIHCVNESGKSNSKREWDLRWGANCTRGDAGLVKRPLRKKKVSSFQHNRGHCCYLCC